MFPLEARNLSRKMGSRYILNQVNLAISRGEVIALLGANGTGKTTLLRCLAGQLRPNRGEVLWFGTAPYLHPNTRHRVGFAAHESCLYLELSAQENLLFAARMHGISRQKERVACLLSNIGLASCSDQAVRRLSQGARHRVSIARAILHDPPIVILDEPFSGLDAEGQRWLENWLSDQCAQMRAICFSSHDARQCHRVAHRSIELRDGNLVPCDPCH